MSTETLLYLAPEIWLVFLATACYLGGTWVKARDVWGLVAAGGLALAGALLLGTRGDASPDMLGPVSADGLAWFGRLLAILVGFLLALTMSRTSSGPLAPELFGSLLLLVVGMMLTATGRDLVLLFLGVELITIPTYVLIYCARRNSESSSSGQEAAVKYFYLSVLATAIMLYGFSFLYGAAGSTDLSVIRSRLEATGVNGFSQAALVLILAGLGFKLAAVPFHFYAPDVYQGTSNPATALLAVAPKFAAVVLLVRILILAMPGQESAAWWLAFSLAVVTMTWGNMVALWQQDLRRLLAYSSIAHGGYMLVGVTMSFVPGVERTGFDPLAATLFYLTLYALATVGIFAAVTYLGRADGQINHVDELAGLGQTHPTAALAMAVCLFSLAGIPPLAGFWGKFMLFGPPLTSYWSASTGTETVLGPSSTWALGLAIVGVLNAAVAAAYYLRVIGIIYFRPAIGRPAAEGGLGAAAATLLCAVMTVAVGTFPRPMLDAAYLASSTARQSIKQPLAPTQTATVEANR